MSSVVNFNGQENITYPLWFNTLNPYNRLAFHKAIILNYYRSFIHSRELTAKRNKLLRTLERKKRKTALFLRVLKKSKGARLIASKKFNLQQSAKMQGSLKVRSAKNSKPVVGKSSFKKYKGKGRVKDRSAKGI